MKNYIMNTLLIIIIIISLFTFFDYVNSTTKEIKELESETITITTDKELEDYLVSVVACEMPALYETEALKAQAIASRTYALYQRDINNVALTKQDQCVSTESDLKEKWQENYDTYYNRIASSVKETEGLVMNLDNKLFKSFYFSTSNGYTEDSMTVFKEGDLKSVDSTWDKENKNYEVTTSFTKSDLEAKLGPFTNINITKRSNTNHVEELMIDETSVTGIKFRKLLGLRSTDFDIAIQGDNYEITTRGYGHGVGMSQYGANMLAKEQKTASEILKYYYGNIEIKKY